MDSIDRHIIDLLVVNGRASLTDIAGVVSLSVPAVKRRIDRLERDGIIRGYTAVIDEPGARKLFALVEVFCSKDANREVAIAAFEVRPEVVLGFTVAGESDVMLLVRADSTDHLESFLLGLRGQPFVARTRAQVVLNTLIGRVPLS